MNEHRVAIAVEAVARSDCFGVGMENRLRSGKRGTQEKQGGLRQMESRHQGVNRLKPVAGSNDETRLTGPRSQPTLAGHTLQGPDGGRAHGNDAMASGPRGGVSLCGFFRHKDLLGLNPMIGDVLDVNPSKSPGTDVEHDFADQDALVAKSVQESLGEMKTRGGGGDASGFSGVDGLISLAIQGFVSAIDVGGKRHSTQFLDEFEDVGLPSNLMVRAPSG